MNIGEHLTLDQLQDFVAGRLSPEEKSEVQSHLDSCDYCEDTARRITRPPISETLPERPPACVADLPERVGRYRVEEEIARGGMGRVVRVRDDDFRRPLAMKLLLPNVPKARFLREARLTGRLQHPGIPPVHELGELSDGSPYFVMKLIQGRTLHELLQQRKSPSAHSDADKTQTRLKELPRFIAIFESVCQTVGYAHSRGVIHRDLKPLNIMVGAFGEVQVMDWGLAKILDANKPAAAPAEWQGTIGALHEIDNDSAELKRRDSVFGTPGYAAPEQARGESDSLDARCDVFSLGSILCEILTGRPAYTGRSRDEVIDRTTHAKLDDAFDRLAACGADAELVELTRRCLAVIREDRPADGAAVAEAVATYQAELRKRVLQAERDRAAAEAQALEEVKRRQVERQKRKMAVAAAGLLAVVALVTVVGIGAFWVQKDKAEAARQEADEQRDKVKETANKLQAANARLIETNQNLVIAKKRVEDHAIKLERIARVERIRRIAAICPRDQGFKIKVEVLKFATSNDFQGTTMPFAPGMSLPDGQIVAFRVTNDEHNRLYVSLIYLGADYTITPLYPDPEEAHEPLGQGKSIQTRRLLAKGPWGLESLLVIAVPANGPAVDFTFLAQRSLERARSATRRDKALKTPLGRVFEQVCFHGEDGAESAILLDPSDYHLQMSSLIVRNAPAIAASDREVFVQSAALTAKDPKDRLRKNCYAKPYSLKLNAGSTYQIDMTSNELEPFLRLETLTGMVLADDDDSGGNLLARLIFLCPQTAEYRIVATTYEPGSTGRFMLRIVERRSKR